MPDSKEDPRIDQILEIVIQLAAGNLEVRARPSEKDEGLNAIIAGLNMLAEEFSTRHIARIEAQRRLDEMLDVFAAFAGLDFTQPAPISHAKKGLSGCSHRDHQRHGFETSHRRGARLGSGCVCLQAILGSPGARGCSKRISTARGKQTVGKEQI